MRRQIQGEQRYPFVGFGLAGLTLIIGLIVAIIWVTSQTFFVLPGSPRQINNKYGVRSGILQMETNYVTPETFWQVRQQYVGRFKVNDHLYAYNGEMCSMMRDTQPWFVVELHTTILICGADSGQRILVIRGVGFVNAYLP